MKDIINAIDKLPLIIKVIIAIFIDIVWVIYRVLCALEAKDTVALIVAIVLFFIPIMPIVDIICLVLKGNVWCYSSAK